MNLYDILKRPDRAVQVSGRAEAVRRDGRSAYLGAALEGGASLLLSRADEFACLSTFPRDIGWEVATESPQPGTGGFELRLHETAGQRRSATLWRLEATPLQASPILLTWPVWAGQVAGFDLELANTGTGRIEVSNGPVFDPRAALRPLLRGRGAEVGPGLNPSIRPGKGLDISYVETLPIEDWVRNYAKGHQTTQVDRSLFDHYVIGDAQALDCCMDGSLDFVFSNHVFEHLMNPIGVLANWRRKLATGGLIAGVVPDLRYCFDLRQPASGAADWEQEFRDGAWSPSRAKFEKWCRYTEPRTTPESLIARNYSVHAHYYTPEGFLLLLQCAAGHGVPFRAFLNTSPNSKDFGFVLWPA